MSDLAAEKAIIDQCESPIETQLGCCLTTLLFDSRDQVVIEPQFKLGRYRYDFAIRGAKDGAPLVLIECDGREFHKTAKQQKNDMRKNLLAEQHGISIVRFPGDEIYLHPMACAKRAVYVAACALVSRRRPA